jgi:IS4 transposase
VKDEQAYITAERVHEIQSMSGEKIKELTTRDKFIWFRHQVDLNTEDFTQGFYEITINRENMV